MTSEERRDILDEITTRLRAKGIITTNPQITIAELVSSPEIAKVLFAHRADDQGWRYHQHQLLDFSQSYNEDELLRYIMTFNHE